MTHKDDMADKPGTKTKKTQKSKNWINWFVPLLLVVIAIATLLFFPKPNPETRKLDDHTFKSTTIDVAEQKAAFNPKEVANALVSTFFNSSDEARTEQIRPEKWRWCWMVWNMPAN